MINLQGVEKPSLDSFVLSSQSSDEMRPGKSILNEQKAQRACHIERIAVVLLDMFVSQALVFVCQARFCVPVPTFAECRSAVYPTHYFLPLLYKPLTFDM